jgi:hypothetical protein
MVYANQGDVNDPRERTVAPDVLDASLSLRATGSG